VPAELDALRQAFSEDHRVLTRGLTGVVDALREADLAQAVRRAEELDRRVGPHMAFEEQVYYPELRLVLGDRFVDRLYHEHALGLDAVRRLIRHDPAQPLPERERIVEELTTALEHARSCGTLLSHLTRLDPGTLGAMRQALEELRRRELRWTEVGSTVAPRR